MWFPGCGLPRTESRENSEEEGADGNVSPDTTPTVAMEMTPDKEECGWTVRQGPTFSLHIFSLSPKSFGKQRYSVPVLQLDSAILMSSLVWVFLALIGPGSSDAHSLFTCEPIKVHRCPGMPYNMTFFPNMMEHYDQDTAARKMEVSPYMDTGLTRTHLNTVDATFLPPSLELIPDLTWLDRWKHGLLYSSRSIQSCEIRYFSEV